MQITLTSEELVQIAGTVFLVMALSTCIFVTLVRLTLDAQVWRTSWFVVGGLTTVSFAVHVFVKAIGVEWPYFTSAVILGGLAFLIYVGTRRERMKSEVPRKISGQYGEGKRLRTVISVAFGVLIVLVVLFLVSCIYAPFVAKYRTGLEATKSTISELPKVADEIRTEPEAESEVTNGGLNRNDIIFLAVMAVFSIPLILITIEEFADYQHDRQGW